MSIPDIIEKNGTILMRGRLGRPCYLGNHWLGETLLGDDEPIAGIYQKRKGKKGQICVQMRHYYPSPGYTSTQLANRSNFASLVAEWHALTTPQKDFWRAKTKNSGKSGFNQFMSHRLRGLAYP